MAHQLTVELLAKGLQTSRIARQIVVLDEAPSTNDYVFQKLAPQGEAADGVTVFAELQTNGRGRLGRSWQAPRGSSLMFTTLLWEKTLPPSPVRWMMASAIAVAQGIAEATELEPTIRWPNDVYMRGRKVSGILVEARNFAGGWGVAVGIGINCLQQPGHFPEEIRSKATSLEIESRHPVDRIRVAQAVLHELDSFVNPDVMIDDERLADLWREGSADIGARATLRSNSQEYRGVIIDVHPQNGLVLQLDGGARKYFDPAVTSRIS